MSVNQKIANVNGTTYVINAFVGTKGFTLLAKLTKYATPIISEMSKLQGTIKEDGAVDDLAKDIDLGSIMQNLFFDGTDGFVELVFDLVRDVQKDGMTINIDTEFKKNYTSLLQLALEVIKLNYDDVFQKLGIRFE